MNQLFCLWLVLLIYLSGPVLEAKVRLGRFTFAAETSIPRGFASAEQFNQAASELRYALAKNGIEDGTIGVRGSSVTGVSFRTGQPFGPASDIDFFVESDQLTQGLKTSSNIPGFVHPSAIHANFDAIAEWAEIWSKIWAGKSM